jgi:hypothetical protein
MKPGRTRLSVCAGPDGHPLHLVTPSRCLPRASSLRCNGVFRAQRPPRRTTAPANADAADQFINPLSPLAETLAQQLPGPAGARQGLSKIFLTALTAWYSEICYDKVFACYKALQKAENSLIALREACDEARKSCREVRHEFSQFGLGRIHDQTPVNEIAPATRPRLRLDISLVIEEAERWIRDYQREMGIEPEPAHKPKGRPSGISRYPQLETLIFLLEFHSTPHYGAFFTAYIKKDGELKVAAGSLIGVLNILRNYLVNDQSYFWLAKFLPLPDEHVSYVSTYQRILAGARFEARDQQTHQRILAEEALTNSRPVNQVLV